jgi:hypothetical protein
VISGQFKPPTDLHGHKFGIGAAKYGGTSRAAPKRPRLKYEPEITARTE